MERRGRRSRSLGAKKRMGRRSYLTELVRTRAEIEAFLSDESRWKRKRYPTMLNKGLEGDRFDDIRALSVDDGFMPGYGPDDDLTIRVLGPAPESDDEGNRLLRWLGSVGETKNGHSVVLRLELGRVSMLLGGDLNVPAEELLLRHHTGMPVPPGSDDYLAVREAARRVFQVDVAKSCHHGSSDFSTLFLDAVNPIASVISSGDNEPYSHPRADALGATGVHSRGSRPLIFSTELARSPSESIKHPHVLRQRIRELSQAIDAAPTATAADRADKAELEEELDEMLESIDRSIAVFGAINVRTDGDRVVVAQKLEQPRRLDRKWDIYRLERTGNGPLRYMSKH